MVFQQFSFVGTTHARRVDARLRAYVQRIWQPNVADSPVAVTFGPAPAGHVVVEQYAVLPSHKQARFLVPMGSRPARVAAFRTYNATRTPLSRGVRALLGHGYDVGVADKLFPDRLVVSIDARFPRKRWDEVLLLQHLARVLDQPSLGAFSAVRQLNPNVKPTLELFDDVGAPVGYAKLGTTDGTRHLVRTEAAAMASLSGALETVIVPELLAAGEWGEATYAISSPLPRDLHRWTRGPQATADALAAITRTGQVTRGPLVSSTYAARLRADIDRVGVSTDEVARALGGWLTRLEVARTPLGFGRVHGDWIPDNLGRSGSRLVVWDWEHSHADAPVGFDLLHWRFHHALVKHDMAAAVNAVKQALPELALLDVPAEARGLTGSLYLLDVFVRRMRLAMGGGGWNARWYPALLDVALRSDRP